MSFAILKSQRKQNQYFKKYMGGYFITLGLADYFENVVKMGVGGYLALESHLTHSPR